MSRDHGPGVRLPPPAMVAALLLAAWGLGHLLPLPLTPPLPLAGWAVGAAALALMGWAALVLLRAGNDPRPDRPDAALVEAGPFRLGRNPIYLGFLLLMAGFALRWGQAWGWLALVAGFLVLDRLVVAREEAYLAVRFGDAYRAYCARVRRWA